MINTLTEGVTHLKNDHIFLKQDIDNLPPSQAIFSVYSSEPTHPVRGTPLRERGQFSPRALPTITTWTELPYGDVAETEN
jgi:hypothetical protein